LKPWILKASLEGTYHNSYRSLWIGKQKAGIHSHPFRGTSLRGAVRWGHGCYECNVLNKEIKSSNSVRQENTGFQENRDSKG